MWTLRLSPNLGQNMKYVTIEPAMFLQMAGDTLNYVIYQNLFIDKICLTELHYSKQICKIYSELGQLPEDDPKQELLAPIVKDIQQASSNFVLYNSLVENSFPVILVLFLGVWSDARRRRKPPLLLSLCGKFLRAVGLFLNAWFMDWPTIYLLIMAAFPHSLGGANAVFHMASFSYIADTSSPRNRTWRLGCAEAFWQLGTPIGLVLAAYLYRTGGYLYVFGTSMLFQFVAVLYTAFLLPEVPQPKKAKFTVGKHGWYGTWDNSFDASASAKRTRYYSENDIEPVFSTDPDSPNNNSNTETVGLVPGGPCNKVNPGPSAPPDPEGIPEDVSVKEFIIGAIHSIFKKRPNHKRKCLLALGFIMLLVGLGHHGELGMRYLFARNKFQWREQQFSRWVIFESIMVVIGITIVMPIVSKLLKLSDPCAGAFAGISRFVSRGIYALADTPEMLYLGSVAEIPGILAALSARSLASKCVLRDERGRVFAFLGCIEALVPLFAVLLYSQVYSYTLDTAPSAIYFLSCGIYLTIFLTFVILLIALKMKVIEFTGTDLSSLTDPLVGVQTIPGTSIPYYDLYEFLVKSISPEFDKIYFSRMSLTAIFEACRRVVRAFEEIVRGMSTDTNINHFSINNHISSSSPPQSTETYSGSDWSMLVIGIFLGCILGLLGFLLYYYCKPGGGGGGGDGDDSDKWRYKDIILSKVFRPYGQQMKERSPWYPQDWCNEWPHQASALSLGESSVIKYGVNYPLRTGLNSPDETTDFVETVKFLPFDDPLEVDGKIIEEVFLSRGVCVISHGPLGGPNFLKGLYRPLTSYGTGVGICDVVKAKFPISNFGFDNSNEQTNKEESFICLAEKGGISIYAENNAETHVAHVPEFQIGKILPCKFGLLLIPSKQKKDQPATVKNMFILTHPIKQVSKVWIRHRPGLDYSEYDGMEERLTRCVDDICIFWSTKNDKIHIRRLISLDKADILQISTLNATMYQTSLDLSGKGFHISGNLQGNSPVSKQPFTRSAAMKANREAGSFTYWPTFDYGTSVSGSSSSIGVGFYPPHVCIYDDPEVYLKPLFQIDLPKTQWKEPRKFSVMSFQPGKIALWFLLKNTLYTYGINVESGIKLGNYNIKSIEDFAVPNGPSNLSVIVLLDTSRKLSLGWLDANYSLVCTSSVEISKASLSPGIETLRVSSVNNMLFGDTIICSTTNTNTNGYVKLQLKNYRNNALVRELIDSLATEFDSVIVTKIIARVVGQSVTVAKRKDVTQELQECLSAVCSVISTEPLTSQVNTGKKFLKAIAAFREFSRLSASFAVHMGQLDWLLLEVRQFLQARFVGENMAQELVPLLPTFGFLLLQENPSSYKSFQNLPEVLQILLNNPDSLRNIQKLVQIGKNQKFIPLVQLLINDVCHRNGGAMHFSAPLKVLATTGRIDYLSGRDTSTLVNSLRDYWLDDTEDVILRSADDFSEDASWMKQLLSLERIFSSDRRLEEVCRLLDSSCPLIIETEQKAEMSDHEYVEEQEKHLLQLVQVTFAAPIGRTALTLRTDDSSYTSLTSFIFIPVLVFAGKCKVKGTSIELNETDLPGAFTHWPQFHNAVAASMSIRFTEPPADAWFAFNKSKVAEGPEQAGMVLGFGLNGILTAMPPTLRHEYLSKENSFTTMAMLLGLAANLAGTGDMSTWKLISLHIGAMLPACTTELDIPRLATLVAPASLGLLFLGTQNSYVAKVLLGEMSKKFTPLSCFGSISNNNSTSVVNPHENTGTTTDREAHSLCAGLGLGFVNLAKGRSRTNGFADDDFDGILRRFVVGGPKPVIAHGDEGEERNPAEQTLPSMWEEYRCCHIEEGDNVNVDVTTPSAIVAVALTYLRTGNEAVLNWLAPPGTLHLLDGVRPDLLMLRSLASILVLDVIESPEVTWLENALLPKTLLQNTLQIPTEFSRLNHESINQCWASIVCGYCLGLGIRYAGTSDYVVKTSIRHYIDLFMQLSLKESKLCEFFPKNFLESCICNLVLAYSLVLAGTGKLSILRLCRHLQRKVSLTPATASTTAYGLEMCISMATGILFLGGGRYSLSNDDKSIAMLLAAVFPKWPINANDNRYHLQSLRHLYVSAAQPRLILPKPMPSGTELLFEIEFLDGTIQKVPAPVLLPPFYLLKRIRMDHDEFFPINFNLPEDLEYLNRIAENKGILNLAKKPIATANCGFVREMSWRQDTNFSPMFEIDPFTPLDEAKKIRELNLVHQLAEWSGMKEIVPSILNLLEADTANETIAWQIRILQWWTEMSLAKKIPTCFPKDLLLLLRTREAQLIDITKPTTHPLPCYN